MTAQYCGIYARLSTTQQEEGTSLDTQIERCEAAALDLGYVVKPEFVWRESWTGTELERPVLDQVRRAVEVGSVDAVVVYSPDRLARDPLYMVMLVREFQESGVALHFVLGASDDSPEGQLLMYIQGYVGMMEHKQIAERTMRGKDKVARSGRLPNGTGSGLYGYDYDRIQKVRTVNEAEEVIVRRVFQWASEGVSRHMIACRLNEANIPTKRGKLWHSLTVGRILGNRAYTGVQVYGQKRYRKVKGVISATDRPESEWVRIEGFTPGIITQAQYERVQERLAVGQARFNAMSPRQRYLLTGIGRCGKCGTSFTGASFQRNKHRYYRCQAAHKKSSARVACDARYIRAGELESLVWSKVVETIKDPAVMIADVVNHLHTGAGDLGVKMDDLRRNIADLKGQQRRLIELRQKDMIDLDLLENQLGPVKALCDEKETTLRVLEEQQRQKDDAAEAGQRIVQFCGSLSERLDNLDFDGQRATLAAFGVSVEATREELAITVVVDPNLTTDVTTIAHTLALRRGRSCRSRLTGIRRGWMNWLPRWRFCHGPARLRCLAGTAR